MRGNQVTQSAHQVPAGRPRKLHLLVLPLAIVAFLALSAPPALAAEAHVIQPPPIGSPGSGDGQISLAPNSGLAVNQTTHDIYVADTNNHRVDQFDATGAFIRAWGADVGGSGIDVCATGCTAGTSSSAPGAFEAPTFLAVDSSAGESAGDVYVADTAAKVVSKFDSSGNLIASWGSGGQLDGTTTLGGSFKSMAGVAVDPNGSLLVLGKSEFPARIYKFSQDGAFTDELELTQFGTSAVGIAVDTSGSIYVGRGNGHVAKVDSSGKQLNSEVDSGTASGLGLDPANDDLYVAHSNNVSRYDSSGNPLERFGSTSLVAAAGLALGGGHAVYVAEADADEVDEFILGIVPDAITEKATEIAPTSVTLNGTLSAAGGADATCVFQYVDEAGFKAGEFSAAASAPCSPAGPFTGASMEKVKAEVSGLMAGTTYYFRLFASNESGANENVNESTFETLPAVQLKTGAASNVMPTSATLNGTITPAGIGLEECLFEYLTEAAYQANLKAETPKDGFTGAEVALCTESPAEIGAGGNPVAVHADVSGLSPLTLYHFRLAAKNPLGVTKGADFLFGPPRISAATASQIASTSATAQGLVNPDGVATTYVVEYVSEADFAEGEWVKATSVPAGGEAIGAGVVDVALAQQLSGLSPSTTYHFRIVATNASGTVEGPDRTFTTYAEPGAGLPDGRAYEQVTPVDKNGNNALGEKGQVQAALSGGGITYVSRGGIPGGEGAQKYNTYLASRALDWSTQGLLPPANGGSVAGVLGWAEDLSRAYVVQGALPSSPAVFSQRDSATHSLRPITLEVGNGKVEGIEIFNYVGASADSSVVVFESRVKLPAGGAQEAPNLYIWDSSNGEISLVGTLNNGVPGKGTLAGSNELLRRHHYNQAQHAVSRDGSRVFFSDADSGQLYLRLNPTEPQSKLNGEGKCSEPALACTVQISASQRTTPDPKGPKPAVFMTATPEGESTFFTSSAKLTNNAKTGPEDEGNDLYRYHTGTGELTDLTPSNPKTGPNGAEVRGVLGASDDGSYVYFAANGVLTSAPNARGEEAKAAPEGCNAAGVSESDSDSCNLYLWHDGAVDFIARLQAGSPQYGRADSVNWLSTVGGTTAKTARVAPDGHTLLFRSQRQLTDYDNEGIPEFYLYGTEDGRLRCVSCNPSGAAPIGTATLRSIETISESPPEPAAVLTRNLSADGDRVFFETPDKLVANDINGDDGCPRVAQESQAALSCQDVYEWEAAGGGSCPSDAPNGSCLRLLSTGTGPEPAFFADADENGANAFFFTVQPLVAQDKDQIVDIYDARVGGGIASQNLPEPPGPCPTPEACRSEVASPPTTQSAGSSSFSGPGNQKPSHAKKKKKSHHKKKQHKKRHSARKHG
jgi:hypothetical protein